VELDDLMDVLCGNLGVKDAFWLNYNDGATLATSMAAGEIHCNVTETQSRYLLS